MKTQLLSDKRLKQIEWKDLQKLTVKEIVYEIMLSWPWLIGSCVFAYWQLYAPAMLFSFFFFLTGLRQSHNAQHYTLGISKKATEWVLFILSICMMTSMHAVKYNHIQHHKAPLTDADVEAGSAKMKWWKAIASGPYFIVLIHIHALKHANKFIKQWIRWEIMMIILLLFFSLFIFSAPWLLYHVSAMIAGECFTSFFAVWTVHHDCGGDVLFSRTVRGKWRTHLFYNMFYHTEHHLFPTVPTCHLPALAKRIDKVIPEIKMKTVL